MKVGDKVMIKNVDENGLYRKYAGLVGTIIDESPSSGNSLKRFFRISFSGKENLFKDYIDLGSWRVEKIIEKE